VKMKSRTTTNIIQVQSALQYYTAVLIFYAAGIKNPRFSGGRKAVVLRLFNEYIEYQTGY